MPPALKRRLGDDVRESGRSFNDIAVGHLAASVAVPFEPSGRAGTPPRDGGSVLLRMPSELKERLVRRAAERKQTVNQLIVGTLSERLGLTGKEPMASNNGSSNGKTPGKDKVRVAIIGVGNCANTSTSADTTFPISSSSPPSTSSRARSASTSPTRSGRTRTTRSSSPTSRRRASP
jgi:hypothetical protein